MSMAFARLALIAILALLGAAIILYALRLRRAGMAADTAADKTFAVALFRDGNLVDATPEAEAVLGSVDRTLSAVITALSPQFPDLGQALAGKDNWQNRIVNDENPHCSVHVACVRNTVRLQFYGPVILETQAVSLLRDIECCAPQLIWQRDQTGKVTWSNAAYQAEIEKWQGDGPSPLAAISAVNETQRVEVAGENPRWFDVTSVQKGCSSLHFATDATALMRADQNRRDFVQALGKTFATLSIGLAIFDKNRQLAMFNPALLDMTRLPVGFLSAMPKIDAVLDRLREMQMMPEPKNYASWREQFTAVESAAKNGTYSESWSLPDGQTYRVTGRPHPDGAFALLFEDITAEVSLTRRFRSDIETSQAVLDTLPDAIAVFSGAGTMVISNRAYGQLWDVSPDLMLDHREVLSEVSHWQDSCVASPMWTQMHDFLQRLGGRKPWSDDAMLLDGRHLRCHAIPIAGGMTMVRFVIAPPTRPILQKLTQIDPAIRALKG